MAKKWTLKGTWIDYAGSVGAYKPTEGEQPRLVLKQARMYHPKQVKVLIPGRCWAYYPKNFGGLFYLWWITKVED